MITGMYPPSLLKAVATHSMLMHLGYDSKEIYIVFAEGDVFVLLKVEGLEGRIRIGTAELSEEEMVQKWKKLIKEWNTGGSLTKEEKDLILESYLSKEEIDMMLQGLLENGFIELVEMDDNTIPLDVSLTT